MTRGFYTILAAQFFSSLADNALLIAAIALLAEIHAYPWVTPLLKGFFVIAYIVLACFVGRFADSRPKGQIMFITNMVKIVGCVALFCYGFLPDFSLSATIWFILIGYSVVGIGAAAYSPAKYGILTELVPAEKLVIANGWMEAMTVISIILGVVIGGRLLTPEISGGLIDSGIPYIDNAPKAAMLIIAGFYLIAAIINVFIPDTGARYQLDKLSIKHIVSHFIENNKTLWKDRLGQISLAVTTLLWAIGATLQFIVLDWAKAALDMPLEQSSQLVGVVAIGIVVGSMLAGKFVPLKKAPSILPYGIAIGASVSLICFIHSLSIAVPALIVIGIFAGFFIVPMNALLQHRGFVLMSAGSSIAVQNFNENIGICLMLGFYSFLIWADLSPFTVIFILSGMISFVMLLISLWYRYHAKRQDLSQFIGEEIPVHKQGQH